MHADNGAKALLALWLAAAIGAQRLQKYCQRVKMKNAVGGGGVVDCFIVRRLKHFWR